MLFVMCKKLEKEKLKDTCEKYLIYMNFVILMLYLNKYLPATIDVRVYFSEPRKLCISSFDFIFECVSYANLYVFASAV